MVIAHIMKNSEYGPLRFGLKFRLNIGLVKSEVVTSVIIRQFHHSGYVDSLHKRASLILVYLIDTRE